MPGTNGKKLSGKCGANRTMIVGIVLIATYLLTAPLLIGLREWNNVRMRGFTSEGEYLAALGSGCGCPLFAGCDGEHPMTITR